MFYTTVSVHQLTKRKGKPWQARAKYKNALGKWKEVSKMLPDARGKKDAERIANKWLEEGNKVKVTVRFRGRQMAHVDLGEETLNKFIEMCEKGTAEKKAVLEGRNLFTILVPKKEK